MSDMLNVAVSGLRAFQRQLETASHNIANSATEGYSRQTVQLGTSTPQIYGSSVLGTGVYILGINRYSDELQSSQLRQASSSYSRLAAFSGKADALNNLFASSSTGLSAALQKFEGALQEVATTPTSTSARQVLLSEAEGLVTRLGTYQSRLDDLDAEINEQLRGEAATINSIASNIAKLNQQIITASSQTGSAPPDLADARDQQLKLLSEHLDVSTVNQDGGTVNVFVGSGQPLVLGTNSNQLVAQADAYDPKRITLAFRTNSGTVDISSSLSGGNVGGLLDARRELIDPARNELGQIAVGLTEAVNTQHAKGIDLNGDAGEDFFAVGNPLVQQARTNLGGASMTAVRTDAGALTADNYIVQYDGAAWSVRRADTGAPVSATTSGSTLAFEGLEVTISGLASQGDSFKVLPTAKAIDGLQVLITDPAQVAAASPITTGTAAGNAGSGTISAGEVLDAGDADLAQPVTIRFTSATAWEAVDSGNNVISSGSYVAGDDIEVNGWRVQIDGAPATGDGFTIGPNTAGSGDNRNALALAAVLGQGVLRGGTESLDGAVTRFVGALGVATASANSTLEAQQIIYEDAVAAKDAYSGVNLDEEAANLVRYQQAYAAAAQVIAITQDLMDTLMNAVRR